MSLPLVALGATRWPPRQAQRTLGQRLALALEPGDRLDVVADRVDGLGLDALAFYYGIENAQGRVHVEGSSTVTVRVQGSLTWMLPIPRFRLTGNLVEISGKPTARSGN